VGERLIVLEYTAVLDRAVYAICHRIYVYVSFCMYIDIHDIILSKW